MSVDPCHELVRALTDYLGPIGDLTATGRDWSSATFTGMQHQLAFTVRALPVFIDALPDVDLPMRGHFVADVRLVDVTRADDSWRVRIEVLTIESQDDDSGHGG